MPVTLKQLAARARVHPSTISRVANNDPSLRIAPATRTRIETLLREVSGKDWTLKLTVRENLPSKPQTSAGGPSENYADDPLIRDALEIFKGEVKP